MPAMVTRFGDMTGQQMALAGGKGGMLAKMLQARYPVPDGFVVTPAAFEGDLLHPEARRVICTYLSALRSGGGSALFAVRSSALSEDSAQASFAGEFETVLNVKADDDVIAAIYTVYHSRHAERVSAYSAAHGMEQAHQMAVVVQLMIPAEMAGVLFTADPVTGSYASMTGNYVYGLGDRLVSGEADAHAFSISRPKGRYEGPGAFRQHAADLYKLAARLEKEEGLPQDIEWAVAGGQLYLLQARPVTTLSAGNLDTYDMNYSLAGDALWTNTNVAEAIPDVYAPFTWSIGKELDNDLFIPGYYVFSGNICGRAYSNISRRVSVIATVLGLDAKRALSLIGDLFGQVPEGMTIPIHPFSRFSLLRDMLPKVFGLVRISLKAAKRFPQFVRENPVWCSNMTARIAATESKEELLALWRNELRPYVLDAWRTAGAIATKLVTLMTLDKKLTKLIGTADAGTLLSNLRGEGGLASLGPVLGIGRVMKGEMSRAEYLRQYGHRGPHEYELSIPDPAEEPNWLERQIAEYANAGLDAAALLQKQLAQYEEARRRFAERYPGKVKWLDKQLAGASEGARLREEGRSEFVRAYRVVRAFARKAGELTGLGEDVFFLYATDIEHLLAGNDSAVRHIPARKQNYERYKAMPPFPAIIRGRFNPAQWARDPNRRLDYFDATMPASVAAPASGTLKGCPGAAGRVEGRVRVLANPEEGGLLEPGEILVANTTNIGWTPLFPKAGAIITDVGAPLSHAAIVARELGIPAVVGCGTATVRLRTGDMVLVDGGQGVVHILDDAAGGRSSLPGPHSDCRSG
ncbi:MAG TPA: PEP/pyruvate-binding domain-containing protein [Symbiobacteriaceae bacterium]|nr:PEP/pyruvate-binding domain-containing protein [Symbiobacteriaceae bacterium]